MIHMSGFANLLNPIVVKEFDPKNPPLFPDDKIKLLGATQEATGAETTAERQSRERNNREILKQASELEKQHEEKVKKHLNWENHTKELTSHLVKLLNAADARIVLDPTNKLDTVPKVIEYLDKRYKNLGDATGSVELVETLQTIETPVDTKTLHEYGSKINSCIGMIQAIIDTPLDTNETWEMKFKDLTFNLLKGFVMKTMPRSDTFNVVFTTLLKPKSDAAAISNFHALSQQLNDAMQIQGM
jgi:type I site-specific restriction-modification system R (restriction) subunit